MSATPSHILQAIWAAARVRFGDGAEQMIRELVGQETDGRTTSTKALTRHEGHRVLDRLNAKNPDAEDAMRANYRSGRPRRSPRASETAEDRPEGKILRAASSEQTDLLMHLAKRCGLTETDCAGQYQLSSPQLMHWMRGKFGVAWLPGKPLRDDIAAKAIAALKKWQRTRLAKWAAAWSEPVAARVCEIGLPYKYDKDGYSIPREADYQFAELGVTFSDGGDAS